MLQPKPHLPTSLHVFTAHIPCPFFPNGVSPQELRTLLEGYGPLDDSEGLGVEAPATKGFVRVRFIHVESAQRAKEALIGAEGEGREEAGGEGREGGVTVGGRRVNRVQYSVMWSEEEEVRGEEGGNAGHGAAIISGGWRVPYFSPSLLAFLPPPHSLLLAPSPLRSYSSSCSGTKSHIPSPSTLSKRPLWRLRCRG